MQAKPFGAFSVAALRVVTGVGVFGTMLSSTACNLVGGDCEYDEQQAVARIIALDEAALEPTDSSIAALCGPAILVEVDVVAEGQTVEAGVPLVTVPESFVAEQGWELGTELSGTWFEIESGTCTPTIFELDADFSKMAADHCVARHGPDGDLTLTTCPADLDAFVGATCDFTDVCNSGSACFDRAYECVDGVFTKTQDEPIDC